LLAITRLKSLLAVVVRYFFSSQFKGKGTEEPQTAVEKPLYPECDKMHKVHEKSQAIGEFIEWLHDEKHIVFAKYHKHTENCYSEDGRRMACGMWEGTLYPEFVLINSALAEFFGIDLNKVEEEKRQILEEQRRLYGLHETV
jgi:hypothetical protein